MRAGARSAARPACRTQLLPSAWHPHLHGLLQHAVVKRAGAHAVRAHLALPCAALHGAPPRAAPAAAVAAARRGTALREDMDMYKIFGYLTVFRADELGYANLK